MPARNRGFAPGAARYRRLSAKCENTTVPRRTAYAPPPYSCTRERMLKVAGTACTNKYTPDPKDPVNAEYLRRWLYPEVLVRNTIQRYWQQGMIGSQNLTGPDADLGARFLNGQAVNLKLPDLTKIQQNAPAGTV